MGIWSLWIQRRVWLTQQYGNVHIATNDAHATLNGCKSVTLEFLNDSNSDSNSDCMHVFVTKGWTAFAFPFVVTCWVLLLGFRSSLQCFRIRTNYTSIALTTSQEQQMLLQLHSRMGETNFGANFTYRGCLSSWINKKSAHLLQQCKGTAAATLGGLFAHMFWGRCNHIMKYFIILQSWQRAFVTNQDIKSKTLSISLQEFFQQC